MNKHVKYAIGFVSAVALLTSISAFTESKSETEETRGTFVVIDVYEISAYKDKRFAHSLWRT